MRNYFQHFTSNTKKGCFVLCLFVYYTWFIFILIVCHSFLLFFLFFFLYNLFILNNFNFLSFIQKKKWPFGYSFLHYYYFISMITIVSFCLAAYRIVRNYFCIEEAEWEKLSSKANECKNNNNNNNNEINKWLTKYTITTTKFSKNNKAFQVLF